MTSSPGVRWELRCHGKKLVSCQVSFLRARAGTRDRGRAEADAPSPPCPSPLQLAPTVCFRLARACSGSMPLSATSCIMVLTALLTALEVVVALVNTGS